VGLCAAILCSVGIDGLETAPSSLHAATIVSWVFAHRFRLASHAARPAELAAKQKGMSAQTRQGTAIEIARF
jgi:hypothetical protein